MEFSGTFELEDTTTEEVWTALSDPHLIWDALPGCEFVVRVDDEDPDFEALRAEYADAEPDLTLDPDVIAERDFEEGGVYAALMEVSLGSVSPSFEVVGVVEERWEYGTVAAGEGSSGNSSFEGTARMELSETDDGVAVDWEAEADLFGRVAQMGQRMINPAANRIIKRFFGDIQDTIAELSAEAADEEGASDADGADEAAAGGGESGAETATDGASAAGGDATTDAVAGDRATDDAGGDPASDGAAGGGLLARLKRLLGIGR